MLLDGVWEFLPDSAKVYDETNLPQEGWEKMRIPSNWEKEGLENYSGTVWFRTSFETPKEGKRHWIIFNGVDYETDVWINGHYLGNHEGYFDPFKFEVTDYLKPMNQLLVKVSCEKEEPGSVWPHHKTSIRGVFGQHDCRPGGNSLVHGQDHGTGGIWNSVMLKSTSELFLDTPRITPILLSEKKARLTIEVDFDWKGGSTSEKLFFKIYPLHNQKDSTEGYKIVELNSHENTLSFVVDIQDPYLWNTWDRGTPYLYGINLQLRGENVSTCFGIREFKVINERWFLNNKPFFPRGTNIIPEEYISTYTKERALKDAVLLKGANVNAVRVHAHITNPVFYEVMDKAGILVWQDFPLQWGYSKDIEFAEEATKQIVAMAKLLHNHPSICVYCTHNEPTHNRYETVPLLAAVLKKADASRYIKEASDFREHPYPGWYWGHYRDFSALLGKPLPSEFGAQALPVLESLKKTVGEDVWPPDRDKWAYHNFQYDQTFNVARIDMGNNIEEFIRNSQEYQYKLLKFAIEVYRRAKYKPITGIFQFMFVDPWHGITWSVVDYWRIPKKGYEALKIAFQPILVSMVLTREKVERTGMDRFPLGDVYVINDTLEELKDVTLKIYLNNGNRFEVIRTNIAYIPPDSVSQVIDTRDLLQKKNSPFKIQFEKAEELIASMEPGKYLMEAELVDRSGNILSYNKEGFEVIESVVKVIKPF